MPTITLTAVVDENGHLELDVPLPPGPVEVVVRPVEEMTREEVRAKLRAAGLLDDESPSPDAMEISDAELERLSKVFASERPISELIAEDREDRV
jgi:hypothetical protein